MGRLDWWNVYDEHTDYQWACQVAAEQVDPTGDRRADLRAAMMTANLMVMEMSQVPDADEFSSMVDSLRNYLKDASDYEDLDDIEAARLIARKDG